MNKLPSSMQSSFGSDEPEPIIAGLSDEGGDGAPSLAPEPPQQQPSKKRRAKDPADKPAQNARRRSASGPVLGIYVTPTAVHGVLVRESGDNYGVMRPFSRQRSAYAGEVPDLAAITPEGDAADGDGDITIQFGDASSDLGAGDLFLDSEFSDLAGIETAEGEFQGPAKKSGEPDRLRAERHPRRVQRRRLREVARRVLPQPARCRVRRNRRHRGQEREEGKG